MRHTSTSHRFDALDGTMTVYVPIKNFVLDKNNEISGLIQSGNLSKTGIKSVEVIAQVVEVSATDIALNESTISLEKGEEFTLEATVKPSDSTDDVVWSSDKEDVATVDKNGKVTAVGGGTATITAKAGDKSATCTVTVTVPVTSVTLNETELKLIKGETAVLTATVNPDDATDKTVTWESGDETVATVVNGKITAVAAGTAIITATSNADEAKKASCTVKVTEPEVTEPDVTEPEVTEPDVTEPEVTEPDVTEPDVTEPDVTTPEEPAITEGSASGETEIKKDTEIKIEIPELNVTLEAKAGTFEEAVLKLIAEVEIKLANASDEEKAAVIAAAIKGLANAAESVSVNDIISITLKDQDGNIVQPVDGTAVKVTLPYDGKSNYVAYIDGDKVEFIKLTIADGFASFEAKHFSDYYLVSLSDDAVKAVEGEDTSTDTTATEPGTSDDPKDDENNKPTGIAIALVPAVAAAAASIIFKKRK